MIAGLFIDIGFTCPKKILKLTLQQPLDPEGYVLAVESLLNLSLKDAMTHAFDCQRSIAFKMPITSSLLLRDLLPEAVRLGADPIIFPSVRGLGRENQDRYLIELHKCRTLIRDACSARKIFAPKIWLDEEVLHPVIEPDFACGLGFDGYVMDAHAVRSDHKRDTRGEFQIVGYCDDAVSSKMCFANGADRVIAKMHTIDQCNAFYRDWYHTE